MTKLNQVIALVKGKKQGAEDVVKGIYHKLQKLDNFAGLSRTYTPKEDDGERLPAESKVLQDRVDPCIKKAIEGWTALWDLIATQDAANCAARADIIVDGVTVVKQVPVTHLLFLDKQLNDVETFITKMPILDPAETWTYDNNAASWASAPVETIKTKKIPEPFIKAAATKEHPAQVEVVHKDITTGTWKSIKFSGAIPAERKNDMLKMIRKLQAAVVVAREEANMLVVTPVLEGKAIFDFLFGGT